MITEIDKLSLEIRNKKLDEFDSIDEYDQTYDALQELQNEIKTLIQKMDEADEYREEMTITEKTYLENMIRTYYKEKNEKNEGK